MIMIYQETFANYTFRIWIDEEILSLFCLSFNFFNYGELNLVKIIKLIVLAEKLSLCIK